MARLMSDQQSAQVSGEVNLPGFFVIGVPKAGTTSIYNYLIQHPQIYLPPIKETAHFAYLDLDVEQMRRAIRSSITYDIEKYISSGMESHLHLALVEKWEHYIKLYEAAEKDKVSGEVCPVYFYFPSSIRRIKERLPEAKIILILREPVSRAHSAYTMFLRDGKIKDQPFRKEVEGDFHSPHKGWGRSLLYIEEGLYYEKIKTLMEVIPRENLLILLFDELIADVEGTMERIYEFIGVENSEEVDYSGRYNVKGMPRLPIINYIAAQSGFIRQFARKYFPSAWQERIKNWMYDEAKSRKLSEEDRKYFLDKYFRNDIMQTGKLIGKDLSAWLE